MILNAFRKVYSTKTFVVPVTLFVLLYNISKFFELEVVTEHTLQNGTILSNPPEYGEYFNVTHILQPTELRINSLYISIYILWMNLIFNILGPFVALAVLNHIVSLIICLRKCI